MMDPREQVVRIAQEIGVNPRLALSIWQQESSQSTDTGLRGEQLSRGRGAAVGGWQVVPYYHPKFPIQGSFEDQTRYALNYLKQVGPAGYYGTGQPPAGHPTTEQYVSQVMGRMGAPDVRMAAAQTPGSTETDRTPTGDPATGRMDDGAARARWQELEAKAAAYARWQELEARAAASAQQQTPLPNLPTPGTGPKSLPPPVTGPQQAADAALGFAAGGTLGWGDEAAGALADVFGTPAWADPAKRGQQVPPGMEGAVLQNILRDRMAQARERSPWTTFGAELAGGIPAALAMPGGTSNALPGMALAGGTMGAISGAGNANTEDLAGRGMGAGIGGSLGAVLSPAIGAAGRFLGTVAGGARRFLFDTPNMDANMLVRNRMQGADMTPATARAALDELGPESMLADVDPNLADLGRTAAAIPGPGKTAALANLQARQDTALDRLSVAARTEVAPAGAENYHPFIARLEEHARAEAAPLYRIAFQARIPITPQIAEILGTPSGRRAATAAQRRMGDMVDIPIAERAGYFPDAGLVSLRFLDQVKRELQSSETEALAGARLEAGRSFGNIKRMLTRHIDSMADDPQYAAMGPDNPFAAYRAARAIYAGDRSMERAAELGRQSVTGKARAEDVAPLISDFAQSEGQAWRIGMMRGIQDKLEDTNSNSDMSRSLVRDRRIQNILALGFQGRNADLERFLRVLDAEGTFKETMNVVSPRIGAQTTPMAMDAAAANQAVSMGAHITGALHGQYGHAVMSIMRFLTGTPKMSPDVAANVIRIVTNNRITDAEIARILIGTQAVRALGAGTRATITSGSAEAGGTASREYFGSPQ